MNQAQIARVAMFAADKARRKYAVPEDSWVDIFSIIRRADSVLMFRPLGQLAGAYLDERDSARGIIINAKHPLSRQRLSAAHELGHLELKHASTLDLVDLFDDEPRPRENTEAERLAENFALWFLMPHRLIDASMRAMQLDKIGTAEDVYRLSLHMGTSYEATARHLLSAKRATRTSVEAWMKVKPATIKRQLAGEFAPDDVRSDIHLLTPAESGTARVVRAGDRIMLQFPELPTTGYRWHLDQRSAKTVELIADTYVERESPALILHGAHSLPMGGERQRLLVLGVRDVEEATNADVRAINARAWRMDDPLKTFGVTLTVETTKRLGIPAAYFAEAA